jgi:HEAT repeat protein
VVTLSKRILYAVFILVVFLPVAVAWCAANTPDRQPSVRPFRPTDWTAKTDSELITALSDESASHRAAAAREVGRRGMSSSMPMLQNLLSDEYDFVRLAAATSLMKMGDKAGVSIVKAMLGSKISYYALAAAEVLIPTGDEAAVRTAQSYLASPYFTTREKALRYLSSSTSQDTAYAALETGLKDEEYQVRTAALIILMKRPGKRSADLLLQYIADRDKRIRSLVVKALGAVGGRDAIPSLLDSLHDPDQQVRYSAANSLNDLTGQKKSTISVLKPERAAQLEEEWQAWWEANKDKPLPGEKE